MNNPVTFGLGGAFLITLGFASGVHPAGFPPSVLCISDTAQTITVRDSTWATVRVSDSALDCPT